MGFWDSFKENMDETSKKMNDIEETQKQRRKIFKQTAGDEFFQFDTKNNLLRIDFKIYTPDEITDYGLKNDNETITSGGIGVGRAVGGYMLAGPIGAVIGGVTKKKVTKSLAKNLTVFVYTTSLSTISDKDKLTEVNYIKKKKGVYTDSKDYKKAAQKTHEIISLLDKISKAPAESKTSTNIDKLKEYKEMLDNDLISQEEFDKLKSKLLDL